MDIRSFMNLDMLQHIQDSFSKATGVAAIAVDSQGQYLTRGSNFTDFCMKYTRNNPEGARRCQKCDTECKGTYFCHAGLMDFSSDIIVDGERVGAIIGGQVLPCEPAWNPGGRVYLRAEEGARTLGGADTGRGQHAGRGSQSAGQSGIL